MTLVGVNTDCKVVFSSELKAVAVEMDTLLSYTYDCHL